MALAPLAYALFTRHMKHDPADPHWPDRDRFVLSCGHASMLLYSCLYLSGYDLTLEDLKQFRQWESRTPGHPEYGYTPASRRRRVRSARASATRSAWRSPRRISRRRSTATGTTIVDHYTYFICSDGDLMEGVSHEAASFAGHFKLGKLIGFYDDNRITIDGSTDLTFTDDTAKRFEALRLAGAAHRRRERPRRDRRGDRRGEGGHDAPDDGRHAHAHRLRQPEEAGHRAGARRAARRRRDRARRRRRSAGRSPTRRSTCRTRRSRTGARRASAARGARRVERRAATAYAPAYPADAKELERRLDRRAARRAGRR